VQCLLGLALSMLDECRDIHARRERRVLLKERADDFHRFIVSLDTK